MSHLTVLCPEASTCPHPEICTVRGCQRRPPSPGFDVCPVCRDEDPDEYCHYCGEPETRRPKEVQ